MFPQASAPTAEEQRAQLGREFPSRLQMFGSETMEAGDNNGSQQFY